ncbi:Hypothetical predicted protein [Mytilus galloprovincialis]|uniref:Uncharacterized protein n=1 Tax=Mytilus galloprovincialis TaxID=29158 RepID=A0A8B6BH68_MYTGA|nr:Hypothetical predicted protein [Mytilus galloprovincialis]
MTMGDDRSDDHLKIFKCLVDTGADVLRSTLERKVLNNNAITFEQYLDNVKHQFYHQFEKNRNKPCCSQSPHVNCNVNGYMDKKIFEKVYIKTSELDTRQCLDRFKVKGGVSTDELDLSDLNFFLWNSNMLSPQEKQSLQTIMTIRSYICHPESTQCYSITELESAWISLENDVLLFAEPYRYKKMVTLQIATLKKYKINELESESIINEMATESEKIIREMKLEVQTRNDCANQLMKEESVGIKNCIKDTYDKTTSFINEKAQKLEENHKVLTTRCIKEIKTTVTEDGSNTRLHSEDQRREIDSHLTESENRVCQTVIHSGGRLEDKLSEQKNEIRKHNVELNADLMEENRKLTAEVMEMKADIKELKTILIGNVGKQKVQLVMNPEQIEKSTELPENGKVDMTAKISQTHVTEDKENEIIENLPPEVEIQTNNEGLPEEAVTETVEITGKRVNSIILELKATPGILHSVDTFKAAILRLVQVMQTAGGIDVDIEDTVTVSLKFESPLTEDQFAVVKCLFAKEWNSDNETKQLLDDCSSISDEYSSTADVDEIESLPELDIYSQKVTLKVVQPVSTEYFTKPSCKYCDDKDKIIRTLEQKQNKSFGMYIRNDAETSLVNPFQDDIGMISKTGKLGMKQTVSTSDDFSSLVSKHTYGLHKEDSKLRDLLRQTHIDDTGMRSVTEKLGMTQKDLKSRDKISLKPQQTHYLSSKTIVDECRNCFEKDEIIIQLDRRLCEIRRRVIEAKNQSVSGNIVFEDLLQFIHQTTNMTSVEEKESMKYKELKSGISSQKSELISDVDVHDPEKKANKKLMESQASQGGRPELDQTEDKSKLSLRISEIRREYASNYYTKTDKQKGLGIIVHKQRPGYYRHPTDRDTTYLQEFFEEIGFVVECTEKSNPIKMSKLMTDGKYYCVFIVIMSLWEDADEYRILHLLSQRSIGKPVIVMSDCTFSFNHFEKNNENNDILIVQPTRQGSIGPYGYYGEKNICNDFVNATRRNRFADIMDILTRMNALYDYPIITFQSSLRKKFCFL